MKIGITLRHLTEYYTHKNVNRRINEAQKSLDNTRTEVQEVTKNVILPNKYMSRENSFKRIIEDSLLLGHNGNGN